MIFIFSGARSGSTWLGKILDSHPDTLYLHEPDISDRGTDLLPFWFEDEPTAEETTRARKYLKRLCAQRDLRTVGTRPLFQKSYRSSTLNKARTGLVYLSKGFERVLTPMGKKITVPDLSPSAAWPRLVVKSVSALGRSEALIRGSGGAMQPVLLLRNPCGVVRSFLQGMRIGAMQPVPAMGSALETRAARQIKACGTEIQDADVAETLAWNWVLSNAEAHAAVTKAGGITLNYETLAQDPEGVSKKLFRELGLAWSEETSAFLAKSAQDDDSYYSVSRDAEKASNRWKTELDPELISRIGEIVCRHPIGRQYFI